MKSSALRAIGFVAACAAFPLVAGCTAEAAVSAGPAPNVVGNGTVTVDWTINGAKDSNLCFQSQATNIDIRVYYADGAFQGEYVADCTAFATTITLPDGNYTASGELRDAGNNPRTTTINIAPFDVVGNSDLNVPVDFPPSSFL